VPSRVENAKQLVFRAGDKEMKRIRSFPILLVFGKTAPSWYPTVNKGTRVESTLRIHEVDTRGRDKGEQAVLCLETVGSEKPGEEDR
jgi:ABC-type microcin C transport system duplicated ATPase subunit YejF